LHCNAKHPIENAISDLRHELLEPLFFTAKTIGRVRRLVYELDMRRGRVPTRRIDYSQITCTDHGYILNSVVGHLLHCLIDSECIADVGTERCCS